MFFQDLKNIKMKDPAAKTYFEIIVLYSGFHALTAYRISNFLYRIKIPFLPVLIMAITKVFTGIEIHPAATIGRNFFIDHGYGVVIGETTEIGDNVTIYQGVTLGGTGKESGKRHPSVGNNVVIGAGAKILGSFNVGDNVNIGANAVILSDVPSNSTVVGIPGRIVKVNGEKLRESIYNLDHIDLPDPIMKRMKLIEREMHLIVKEIKQSRENCKMRAQDCGNYKEKIEE